jgi:predicted secreted acid phosphatase
MKNTIIFDLDGTLANVDARRKIAIKQNGKMDWNKWFDPSNIKFDTPNDTVIKMAQLFAEDGFNIFIFSGRLDTTKHTTLAWLTRNRVPFHKLVMRDKDRLFMPDDQLKKQLLDEHADIDDVFLVVDDRQKVVDMWRENGLTVFQVADGNF